MKLQVFYDRVNTALAASPEDRRAALVSLHAELVNEYLDAVRAITPGQAARRVRDGRTVAEVVGHIAEWDRYTLLAAGELLSGVVWPRIMSMTGYVDTNGEEHSFAGVDDFNAFVRARQADIPWKEIQRLAEDSATCFYTLMSQPRLLSAAILQGSRETIWKTSAGEEISLPCGWYLWLTSLEHIAVDHAADLSSFGGEITRPIR